MEAIRQLTGGIAHDFICLAGITGSLEIRDRRLGQGRIESLARYVSAARGAAKRAATLTHRLLAFSRRQQLEPQATDVNRVIGDLEDMLRRTCVLTKPFSIEALLQTVQLCCQSRLLAPASRGNAN